MASEGLVKAVEVKGHERFAPLDAARAVAARRAPPCAGQRASPTLS